MILSEVKFEDEFSRNSEMSGKDDAAMNPFLDKLGCSTEYDTASFDQVLELTLRDLHAGMDFFMGAIAVPDFNSNGIRVILLSPLNLNAAIAREERYLNFLETELKSLLNFKVTSESPSERMKLFFDLKKIDITGDPGIPSDDTSSECELSLPIQSQGCTIGLFTALAKKDKSFNILDINHSAVLLNALGMGVRNQILGQNLFLANQRFEKKTEQLLKLNEFISRVNTSLEAEELRHRKRFQAICTLADSIFDLQTLVKKITNKIIEIVNADSCAILRIDTRPSKKDDSFSILRDSGNGQSRACELAMTYGSSVLEHKRVTGAGIFSDDLPGVFKASMEDINLQAHQDEIFMVLPLIARETSLIKEGNSNEEKSLGVISVYRKPGKPSFNTSELGIVQTISAFAAIALEKAELYRERSEKKDMERELDIARSIQEGLLPAEMPIIPGLEITAASIPAKTIGGDFYDFLENPDGCPAFMIADVSGKGVSAALLTNMARSAFRGIAGAITSPGEVISRVNSFLCDDIDPYRFITIFYMIFDPVSRRLTYSNAGHSPALICSESGDITECTTPGPAIGIMPDIPYVDSTIILEKGDIVLLYTDGITESRSKDGVTFYGFERLRDLIHDNRDLEVSQLKDCLLKEIKKFSGDGAQHDDLTLVLLKLI